MLSALLQAFPKLCPLVHWKQSRVFVSYFREIVGQNVFFPCFASFPRCSFASATSSKIQYFLTVSNLLRFLKPSRSARIARNAAADAVAGKFLHRFIYSPGIAGHSHGPATNFHSPHTVSPVPLCNFKLLNSSFCLTCFADNCNKSAFRATICSFRDITFVTHAATYAWTSSSVHKVISPLLRPVP